VRRLLVALVATIFAMSAPITPVYAGKKDDAWAKCLWEQVPTTANNWLLMAPAKVDYDKNPTPPEYAIEWRLQAACFDVLKPANKKWPPSFNAKAVRATLAATKPAVVGTDKIDPIGFRCDLFFEDDVEGKSRAGFDWGVKAGHGDVVFLKMRYGFKSVSGGAVQLQEGAGIRKCYRVLTDGTMINA
jgi:hypothetical protein